MFEPRQWLRREPAQFQRQAVVSTTSGNIPHPLPARDNLGFDALPPFHRYFCLGIVNFVWKCPFLQLKWVIHVMNKSYRFLWKDSRGACVAAFETGTAKDEKSAAGVFALAIISAVALVGAENASAQQYFNSNSVAVGNQTLATSGATGAESIAVGPNAVANGISSVAVGNSAAASLTGSVALGAGAKANTVNTAGAEDIGITGTDTGNLALGNGSLDKAPFSETLL